MKCSLFCYTLLGDAYGSKEKTSIEKQSSAAMHMHELQENYITLDKEISTLQNESSEARREINSLRIKSEEMLERAEQIHSMDERLDELRVKRQGMGLFTKKFEDKKTIDHQIQQHERLREQATGYFKRKYKIDPEQAELEVERLEATAKSKKHLSDKLQEKITSLAPEREAFLLDYQWQRLSIQPRSLSYSHRV